MPGFEEFERKTIGKLNALVRQSAQDVIAAANTPQPSVKQTGGTFELGKVPVDTGFLRNSLVVELTDGGGSAEGGDAYAGVIAGMEVGAVITATWTAAYAGAIEYGTDKIAPRMFVRYNIERWPEIVETNARRIAGAGP